MRLLALILTSALLGCAQGNCRSQSNANSPENKSASAKAEVPTDKADRIRVFKYDGSLQCGMGKPIAIEEMSKDLKGLRVYSAVNKADGLMHIAQCGAATGKANVYEIDRKDLVAAQKAGFKQWLWD